MEPERGPFPLLSPPSPPGGTPQVAVAAAPPPPDTHLPVLSFPGEEGSRGPSGRRDKERKGLEEWETG